jgi:hypothetical protein
MRSWKTSFCGLLMLFGTVGAQYFPEYARLANFLAAIGAGLGLLFARDNNVTSEQAGAIKPPTVPPPMIGLLLVFAFLLAGCSVLRIKNVQPNGAETTVTAYVPAWPWQDSGKNIERLTVSARTNSFNSSLKGLEDTETTSTNAANLLERTVSAAVGAAVKAAIPP